MGGETKTGLIRVVPVATAAYSHHRGCRSLGQRGKDHEHEEESLPALHVDFQSAGRAVLGTTREVVAEDKHFHHHNRH